MKAYVLRSYGSAELREIDTPSPADNEVLVRVRATSVNPYDWHFMKGEPYIARLMPSGLGLRRPKMPILGCDMAGQVEAVGKAVTRWQPGDDVFALREQGGFAEYVTVPEDLLVSKPKNLSYEQAAAVPMAAVSALLGLRDVGKIQPGQKVLVNGAAGGVGTFAVQIARALDAIVIGVCSGRNTDLVRSIGAHDAIDYGKEDFTRTDQRYDLLLDIAGSRSVRACRRAMTPKGTFVSIGGKAGRWLQPVGHLLSTMATAPMVSQRVGAIDAVKAMRTTQHLTMVSTLIEDGKVTPVIDRCYPFEEIQSAVAYQEQGHTQGKVVVTV
ncbi:NAD(P)-dependent alcohol dehydrogenase [Actinocrispum wychmicini]|uniref:NADPH:quinone reductase-like Zn-dependent oxidoreductase n=1 Tax=Actinocrispum wychmicini TaxID=1213861 RepID=A0A4R2ITK8_9PSEU|nr:NAD(P)-dependent alcohol dehydrogenase [Actinocrispum wychmicini]TCO48783.1 NADPH:quinone reductase-like Zn-dependent oxidoreductase [Actinocrispum wychmicini]